MSEENKRWRCPYCDGLNDWQNVVCEICGDGRRNEAETAEKAASAAEMPKTYTPQKRELGSATPKREPEREASRPTYAPPPAPEPPKKKKKGGIWVAIVLVALAAFGGRQLANGFVNSMKSAEPTIIPVALSTPEATQPPEEAPTEAVKTVEPPAKQPAPARKTDAPDFPQTTAGAGIESITDNGDGTVSVKLRQGGLSFENYEVYYTIVPEGEPYVDFTDIKEMYYYIPRGQHSIHNDDPIDTPRIVEIVPGQDLQFYVCSYNGYNAGKWWKAEQLYNFPERSTKLPIELEDVKFCVWDTWDDFRTYSRALFDLSGQPASALPDQPVHELSTAADLFDVLSHSKPMAKNEGEIQEDLVFTFKLLTNEDSFRNWRQLNDRIQVLLVGPGIALMGSDDGSVMSYKGSGICIRAVNSNSILKEAYDLVRAKGTFPTGEYTLRLYYNGAPVGSYSFSLS